MNKQEMIKYVAGQYAEAYNEDNPQLPLKRKWRFYEWEARMAVHVFWPLVEELKQAEHLLERCFNKMTGVNADSWGDLRTALFDSELKALNNLKEPSHD